MKLILSFSFLLIFGFTFSQSTSEINLYSFNAKKGKTIALSKDTLTNRLIYRCSKKGIVEFEMIDDLNDNTRVFSYSYYFRPGGKENAGLELYALQFEKGEFTYKVYYEYSAEENKEWTGLNIINKSTGEAPDIEGKVRSIVGSLGSGFSELVPISED